MTLTRSLPTQHASGLPLIDERRITVGLFAKNTDGTVRTGVLPAHTNPLVTGRASMGYDVAAFNAVTARTSAGAEEIANDASVTVTTTAAPGANSRIDVVWVRSQFVVLGDANNDVVFGVTQGTAAVSPTKPAIPAGALELATANIPSTATTTLSSGVVITQTHQYTASAGGTVWLRNATEQTAFTPAGGTVAWRLDTQQRIQYMSGATVPGWFHIGGKPTISAPTFTSIYSASSLAPRVVEQAGRISLEGVVASTNANFVSGTTYTIGSIPATIAPVQTRVFACTSNGTALATVAVSDTGAITMVLNSAFTGLLSLSLAGCSWPDKNL